MQTVRIRRLPKYEVLTTVFYKTRIKKFDIALLDEEGRLIAHLYPSGKLRVFAGSTYDGPSGPAIDTTDFMDGSLTHDMLYAMMKQGLLSIKLRKLADLTMLDINRRHGMSEFRCRYTYWAVRIAGRRHAKPTKRK